MKIHNDKIVIAIICCLTSHFMFAVMGAGVKYLAATHHVAEIAFYRSLIVFFPLLTFILISKKTHLFKTARPKMVGLRAILGGVSLIVTFAALSKLPMAYATVLFFTSSLLTPVFAFFFLKEHVGLHRWGAVFIGMCGVIIIAQPSGEVSTLGLIMALIAAILHAINFTTLRSLRTESPITITFYFIIASIVISAAFMPWVAQSITRDELWIFLLIGFTGGISQIILVTAYKYGPASLVTPFSYTALLWTILIDVYIWNYDLEFTSVMIGAGLIMSAQLYIIYREYINKRKTIRKMEGL